MTIIQMPCFGRARVAAAVFAGFTLAASASPGAVADDQQSGDSTPSSLLQAWLAYENAVDVAWPYAYMQADTTQSTGEGAREDLFDEFDQLHWRLTHTGYDDLAATVTDWRTKLAEISVFRVPGDWSPSFLLSHPNQQPPIDRIAAIGSCDVPDHVGVWSAAGYEDIPWHTGMQISDIERRVPALRKGSSPEISVVDVYGHIDHYGVQAWNYADGPVSPGTQVVASLPLKGEAFQWIRDSMADLLAHSPSGVDCRQEKMIGDSDRDEAGS